VDPLQFTDVSARDWYTSERSNLMAVAEKANDVGFHRIAWQIPVMVRDLGDGLDPRDIWVDIKRMALASAERHCDRFGEAMMRLLLATDYRLGARFPEARDSYDHAARIFGELGNGAGEAEAMNGAGLIALWARDMDAARDLLSQVLDIAERTDDQPLRAVALSNLGNVARDSGDIRNAEDLLTRSITLFQMLKRSLLESHTLFSLASALRSVGRLVDARDKVEQSLRIARTIDNPMTLAYALHELASIDLAESRAQEALISSRSAADIFKRLANPRQEAVSWGLSGQALGTLGRHEDAAALHEQAVIVHRGLNEHWLLAQDLDALASELEALGEPDEARACWVEASIVLSRFTDPVATRLRESVQAHL
jgi:tetratricopeptide (TPR) repeat protein